MQIKKSVHFKTVLQALLVTLLWSSSFIIIKKGLIEIPPVLFAGLRYFSASLCFIPIILKKKYRKELSMLNKQQWIELILLGFLFYVLTQGLQFIGLSLLPSTTVSLMLNFAPLIVLFMGIKILDETPTKSQITGIFLFIVGVIVFFIPFTGITSQKAGLAVMSLVVISNASSAIVGRKINSRKKISPVIVTFVSMSFGSIILITSGILLGPVPVLSAKSMITVLWLSVINTAFAFTLWNKTLQTLSAAESSVINSTMLIQIALLAFIFLGESLTIEKVTGIIIASAGAILVQIKKLKPE